MFSKILIANRGEIAVRIIRACKEMGILTVAVFSEADRDALHVSLADESYCIGPAKVSESYLNMSAIISAAVASHAEAIHPGYGLLSENAAFSRLCEKCNICFIGPRSETITRMGNKDEAKKIMINAGVPVIPGSEIVKTVSGALSEADRIGFPLLIKAVSGGGGKGIRLVTDRDSFAQIFATAEAEAQSSFGNGSLYLEKYLRPVKHIEMQLLCDHFGNVVCLGERDCSVQRNNQKIIEESPCAKIDAGLRQQMVSAAIAAANAVNYRGVGTVEFLLDKNGNFYFMEMNTRLQVEHPVTEFVTGIDLVKWQIRVAAGLPLEFKQEDIILSGHAIECRINAENPMENYRPSCGKVTLLHIPGGPWVRFDTALYQGYIITPFYDSMVGKLIVHAHTRDEAIRKMQAALCELAIEGIECNSELHTEILDHEEFVSGKYCTDILTRRKAVD